MTHSDRFDVVIMGGGLAGQCLARELLLGTPTLKIAVVEKRALPVAEAAHKVGESTVELASHYLGERLKLREYLEDRHLPKAGLRYFFPRGDNRVISERTELGLKKWAKLPSYQLDRGRLENDLARMNEEAGIAMLTGTRVTGVESVPDGDHTIELSDRSNQRAELRARWVVDATGRGFVLKKKKSLALPLDHNVNAVWFRVAYKIEIADLSPNMEWRERIDPEFRRLATVHFMDNGYWVWLIPLSSGSTSVGIVADEKVHPFDTYNNYEKARAWLAKHEPLVFDRVPQSKSDLQDFKGLKHYAHDCASVFTGERWCITGEAGGFLDPFYSPGSDFISISNGYVVDLIRREMAGEDIAERAKTYDLSYLTLLRATSVLYVDMYPLLGNARVMTSKIYWDTMLYWGFTALLGIKGKYVDLEFMDSVRAEKAESVVLNTKVQAGLRRWATMDAGELPAATLDFMDWPFAQELHLAMERTYTDDELRERLQRNVEILRKISDWLAAKNWYRDSVVAVASSEQPQPQAMLQSAAEAM